jgi:hypothetical protein
MRSRRKTWEQNFRRPNPETINPRTGKPYPFNARPPRLCIHAEDAVRAHPRAAALRNAIHSSNHAEPVKGTRSIKITIGYTQAAQLAGRTLRNPGETKTEAMPISTLRWQLDKLHALRCVERIDPKTNRILPFHRERGDGRERSTYLFRGDSDWLEAIVRDEHVATPQNRMFFTRDGGLLPTVEFRAWDGPELLKKNFPEAWNNNTLSQNPDGPVKPLRPTKPKRQATAEEIATIQQELRTEHRTDYGSFTGPPISDRQAASWLEEARKRAPLMPAAALAEAIREAIAAQIRIDQRHHRRSSFTPGFIYQRISSMSEAWSRENSRRLQEQAEEARRAERATRSHWHDPP